MTEVIKNGIESIERIQFDKFEKDFSFIVNDEVYKTNLFVANILSPIISKMFKENMNRSYFQINSEYKGDFKQILKYGEMKEINIKQEEKQYFACIMKQLGNSYAVQHFYKELDEDISYENVVQRIQIKKELNINFNEEITFISSNFHDFHSKYPEEIFTFDVDIIEQIISNNKLKLSDEEELFDIIIKLYIKSKEYSELFSHVNFMNLSSKSIREFINNFDINDINHSIWDSICYRLEQDISIQSKERYQKSHTEFLDNRYLTKKYTCKIHDRIIQYLREQCHGNVHTKNIVTITSSSFINGMNVENIVEQDDSKIFETNSESHSWIQFDFKKTKVLLNSYTLKTHEFGEGYSHLKSWILEVSNDGKNYSEIDRHENCNLLNGSFKTSTFKVSCSTPQRFVRLTQIGKNWGSNDHLKLSQIEFSGNLYE